ncbi:uncharacterized protein LOC126831060 isoform X1 [Patella vulgata]|uniref:uncharacterized protein LOC126831060 isoform X1 n=2 Tax=Patella vulgata TaxID=6465 RepID=UPI0024A8AE9A|nr:uncharacterized protein LOC126831060 isoform X1 [Patella vulgata]XP_050417630.2 uncharacterized protein LOC126831060 isoform X1 [Patella vulgata]
MAAECSENSMTFDEPNNRISVSGKSKRRKGRSYIPASLLYRPYPSGVLLRRASVSGRLEEVERFRETGIVEIRCQHCQKRQSHTKWTKIKMLRVLGQCVFFLIFIATCAGLILNKTLDTDYDISHEHVDQYIDSDILMDVQLNPVTLSDFRKTVRGASNPYDLIRIFLKEKDISDNQIHELLTAKTIETLLTGKREIKRQDEYYDYDTEKMLSSGTNQMEEELAEAYHHIDEMETSRLGQCKYPQPEIVHIEDENNENKMYFPECTVLHRCRNVTGCCGNATQECGPKTIKIVTKTFLVLTITDPTSGSVLPHKNMVMSLPFVNHTECGCKERKGLPGCHQECPSPFTKFRPDVKCVCDCLEAPNEENYLCESMKDGLIPLAERDLICIKTGRCMPPLCNNKKGQFDVRSGFCPELEPDELGLKGYIQKTPTNTSHYKSEEKTNNHVAVEKIKKNKAGDETGKHKADDKPNKSKNKNKNGSRNRKAKKRGK